MEACGSAWIGPGTGYFVFREHPYVTVDDRLNGLVGAPIGSVHDLDLQQIVEARRFRATDRVGELRCLSRIELIDLDRDLEIASPERGDASRHRSSPGPILSVRTTRSRVSN